MNWRAFAALFARDVHIARRNIVTTLAQTLLQPLMFAFIFGQVLTRSGMMTSSFKGIVLPGLVAIGMVMTGVWAVAMPLLSEFQFTKEIEDRLLAPIRLEWLAVEKILAGTLQALASGAVAGVTAWLMLGSGLGLSRDHLGLFVIVAILAALSSAAGGLVLGCSVGQTHIGLLFSLVLAPMIMFGCAYYPWSALSSFPILQKAVLLNPLVYASEGLRGTLAPQYPHISTMIIIVVLGAFDVILVSAGLYRFRRKAVT